MTKRITFEGKDLSLREWSRRTCISEPLLHWRLTNGWSAEEAMRPPRRYSLARDMNEVGNKIVAAERQRYDRITQKIAALQIQQRETHERLMAQTDALARRAENHTDRTVTEMIECNSRLIDRGEGVNFRNEPSDRSSSSAQDST